MFLAALTALIVDRILLCQRFLFRYTDHDQTLLWSAAHDVLHGHFPEPCFYGQSYNSYVESILAVPLIACSVPYHMALPIIAVTLGLAPFVALAVLAHMHRCTLAACVILCIPLCLPVQYAIVAGLPRGFVTGLGLATIPLILLLYRRRRRTQAFAVASPAKTSTMPSRLRKFSHRMLHALRPAESLRYFIAATVAAFAAIINPNVSILLLALYVIVFLARHQNWRFWLFSSAGIALSYQWKNFIWNFYEVLHPDYNLHQAHARWPWSSNLFDRALNKSQDYFSLYMPTDNAATTLLLIAAGLVILLLMLRQFRAATAAMLTAGFIVVTLAYSRVHDGERSVYFTLGRHYLAIPVVVSLLIFFLDKGLGRHAWIRRVLILALLPLVILALQAKYRQMPAVLQAATKNTGPIMVRSVEDVYKSADHFKKVLADTNTDIIVFPDDPLMAYALPALVNCQTLHPSYERRTWRLHEESIPRYQRILINTWDDRILAAARKIDPDARVAAPNPKVFLMNTAGRSVIDLCKSLRIGVRSFTPPPAPATRPATQPTSTSKPATAPKALDS